MSMPRRGVRARWPAAKKGSERKRAGDLFSSPSSFARRSLFLALATRLFALGSRGRRGSRRSGAFRAFNLLLFLGFLHLLDDQLDHLDLGQVEGAAALGPALLGLQLCDALAS